MIGKVRWDKGIIGQVVEGGGVQCVQGIDPQFRRAIFKSRAQVKAQAGPAPVDGVHIGSQHRAKIGPPLDHATFQHHAEHFQRIETAFVALPDVLQGVLTVTIADTVQHRHVLHLLQRQKLKYLVVKGADMFGEPDLAIVQKIAAVDPAPDRGLTLNKQAGRNHDTGGVAKAVAVALGNFGQLRLVGRLGADVAVVLMQQVKTALHHFGPGMAGQFQKPGKQPRSGHIIGIDKGDVAGVRIQAAKVAGRGAAAVQFGQQMHPVIPGIGVADHSARPIGGPVIDDQNPDFVIGTH